MRQSHFRRSPTRERPSTGCRCSSRSAVRCLHDLRQCFAEEVPAPLARLVRRQGGGLLWRKRGARPEAQTLFELAGSVGRELLQGLSPAERRRYLNAEAERLRLNARFAIANAATRSLSHYLECYGAIRALRKSSETG